MQKIFFIVFMIFAFTWQSLNAQNAYKTITEDDGGFSYQIPASWNLSKMQGLQFHIAMDKVINGFRANVNFHQEKNKYSFAEYYKLNVEDMKSYVSDYKEIKSMDFATGAGLKVKKHLCSSTQGGKSIFQAFYFLETKDKTKTIITGTCLFEDQEKYLPIFDDIAESFKSGK